MARPVLWKNKKKQIAIETILEKISEGKSLRAILSESRDKTTLPNRKLFNAWLGEDSNLQIMYRDACEFRTDVLFDEILEIADDNSKDLKQLPNGKIITDTEAIQRSKLRIEARKWALSKMLPNKYGQHPEMQNSNLMQPIFLDIGVGLTMDEDDY